MKGFAGVPSWCLHLAVEAGDLPRPSVAAPHRTAVRKFVAA